MSVAESAYRNDKKFVPADKIRHGNGADSLMDICGYNK